MSANDLNNTSQTNWEALESMSDEDIDYSDIPPLTDEFFEKATLRIPTAQAKNLIQLDPDVIAWFQAQGSEYKTLINAVLRRHIESSADQQSA
ncbi:BrnA antitoxin family protein [Tolypothrix sp. FACHB-123]|uniref:BrnA antitoxin family protein n=1 Tax=Tolypothrix sp. FACHB-123 TaxID=2692868 RepID=UPI001689A658|nr:BrnA antitoxin family protein [Tolypothrix sp. FACHB-123]MBD2359168.1 BrnA antitoxin family protein [Tolypothrix sp. FACHB-123]